MPRLRRPRHPLHTVRRAAAVLLGIALVLAARPASPPAPPPVTRGVAVAATDLPAGSVLTADRLLPAVARLPPELVPGGTSPEPQDLVGRVLAGGVRAGEPLTDVRLVGPGLTAQLPEGQVAAPVRLADLAVAGLVRTGDRVDVLATPPGAAGADVLAPGALVLAAAAASGDASDPASGLLLLAVDDVTATRLAAAATTDALTISLSRQDAPGGRGPPARDVGG